MMGQQSKELENLFRKLSEHHSLKPSIKVLRKLRFRLWVADFFSFNLRKVNLLYSVIVVGGVATGVYLLQKPDTGKTLSIEEPAAVHKKEPVLPDGQVIAEAKKAIPSVTDKSESTEEEMFHAMFEAETYRGCAPFHVEFHDRSVMADSWHWDFGTGDYSEKQHPEYTYRTQGHYKAVLKVKSKDGREDIYYREIEVLRSPVASFEIDEDKSEIADRKLVFKNTSEGAANYSWDFGDNKHSEAQQASHIYDNFGVYNVKLSVKASNGCRDTATLVNRFIDQDYALSFPQTFQPSPFDKSNNGFYENAGSEAFIFYPKNYGAKKYNLTIYTANGIKVFETNNIKQGWNGYFGGSLAPGGIYTYVAKGIYPNGKSFEVKGNFKVIIDDYYYKF